MEKLKRFAALFMSVIMLFALTACGGSGSGSSKVTIPAVEEQEIYNKDGRKITFQGVNITDESKYMIEHGQVYFVFNKEDSGWMRVTSLLVNGREISYLLYAYGEPVAAIMADIGDLRNAGIKNVENITVSFKINEGQDESTAVLYETGPVTIDFTK